MADHTSRHIIVRGLPSELALVHNNLAVAADHLRSRFSDSVDEEKRKEKIVDNCVERTLDRCLLLWKKES